jgi:hypothetical protein
MPWEVLVIAYQVLKNDGIAKVVKDGPLTKIISPAMNVS